MQPFIKTTFDDKLAIVTFFHPLSNSFPSSQLKELSTIFDNLSSNPTISVIILKSEGKTFCAGASFDELLQITDLKSSQLFFCGFGQLLNSMKNCKKTIITFVQGKAVGGGVGIISASDYVIASEEAAIKLSELNIGFGPYVIEPFVSKKLNKNNFYHLTLNGKSWFNAHWALSKGLFNEIHINESFAEKAFLKAKEISNFTSESLEHLKEIYWQDLNDYEQNFPKRAGISGKLILSEEVKTILEQFKNK
jgi:methylglutaconyl-CoA hydratase